LPTFGGRTLTQKTAQNGYFEGGFHPLPPHFEQSLKAPVHSVNSAEQKYVNWIEIKGCGLG